MIIARPQVAYCLPAFDPTPRDDRAMMVDRIHHQIRQMIREQGRFIPEGWGGMDVLSYVERLFGTVGFEVQPLKLVAEELAMAPHELMRLICERDAERPIFSSGWFMALVAIYPAGARLVLTEEQRWKLVTSHSYVGRREDKVLRVMTGEREVTEQSFWIRLSNLLDLEWPLGSRLMVDEGQDWSKKVWVDATIEAKPVWKEPLLYQDYLAELFESDAQVVEGLGLPCYSYRVPIDGSLLAQLERID